MSESTIVRISGKAKQTVAELARKSGEPMQTVIDKAVEDYRRRVFLEETNRAYARLRSDAKASRQFDEEMSAWDATLADGLGEPEHAVAKKAKAKPAARRAK